jgi:hypothetical protein
LVLISDFGLRSPDFGAQTVVFDFGFWIEIADFGAQTVIFGLGIEMT